MGASGSGGGFHVFPQAMFLQGHVVGSRIGPDDVVDGSIHDGIGVDCTSESLAPLYLGVLC